MGKVESGTDGETAWQLTTFMGVHIKKGEELALAKRDATFDKVVRWRDLYTKAECIGIESVGDRPCYKVVLTPRDGKDETHYFDKETFLRLKMEMTASTMAGDLPIKLLFSDYKKVDGLMISHRMEQVVSMRGDHKTLFITESVEHNVDMPPDRFALPPKVQAVVDAEREKQTESNQSEPSASKKEDEKP
jgi:hypothetical protein